MIYLYFYDHPLVNKTITARPGATYPEYYEAKYYYENMNYIDQPLEIRSGPGVNFI